MIDRLMGSYPSLVVHDPKTFIAELVVVLMRYPPSVSEYGMTAARRASPQYIPSISQIEEACESYLKDQTRVSAYAADWQDRANTQLEQREQYERENTTESAEYRRKAAERILADYKSKTTPETKSQLQTWQRLSNDELMAKYAKTDPSPNDEPS